MECNIEKSELAETVEIAPSIFLSCWMDKECDALSAILEHNRDKLTDAIMDPGKSCHEFKVAWNFLDAELKLCLVNSSGEIRGSGYIKILNPITQQWNTLFEEDGKVLLRYAPGIGEVAGSATPHPAVVNSQEFGKSQPDGLCITRIFVDDNKRLLTNVGQMVKRTIFADYPDLVINIMASVGEHDAEGRGSYGLPESIWFNVFVGYYQIDALKSDWRRPFGYCSANGLQSEVNFEDLMRLGKSDWNYFSNWMYGVPMDWVAPHDEINMNEARCSQLHARVRSRPWHLVELGNWQVVTAYESDRPLAADLVKNSVLTGLWREAFGLPNPRPAWPDSFIPMKLATKFYMSYFEDDESYHSVIFGGSSPEVGDRATVTRFLDVQLAACQKVIEDDYPSLGFAAD